MLIIALASFGFFWRNSWINSVFIAPFIEQAPQKGSSLTLVQQESDYILTITGQRSLQSRRTVVVFCVRGLCQRIPRCGHHQQAIQHHDQSRVRRFQNVFWYMQTREQICNEYRLNLQLFDLCRKFTTCTSVICWWMNQWSCRSFLPLAAWNNINQARELIHDNSEASVESCILNDG